MQSFLLTNDQKTFINGLFDIPFNVWSRPIKILTVGASIVVSSNPNYNYNYNKKDKNTQVTETVVEGTYQAIVDYSPTITDEILVQLPELKNKTPNSLVRISVQPDAAALIGKAKDIQFDDHSYEVKTPDLPRGMFDQFNYYDFWLVRKS